MQSHNIGSSYNFNHCLVFVKNCYAKKQPEMLYVIFFSMFSRFTRFANTKNLRFEVRSQKSNPFAINVCVIQYLIVSNVFQFMLMTLTLRYKCTSSKLQEPRKRFVTHKWLTRIKTSILSFQISKNPIQCFQGHVWQPKVRLHSSNNWLDEEQRSYFHHSYEQFFCGDDQLG